MNGVGRTALAAAAALVVSLIVGLGVRPTLADRASGQAAPLAGTAPRSAASLATSGSVYDLGLEVVGSDGGRHPLGELRGHPVLASMFYSTCPTVCPMLISDLKRIQAVLPPDVRAEVRVLLISFDPARDRPAVLKDVIARHGLDGASWLVGTAEDEDGARTLAGVLGIRYRAGAAGGFQHTTRIVLLDREGRVQASTDGGANASATFESAIRDSRS